MLSAHYDHLGIRDGRIYPGADDNASGVAALLEMAAQCMAQPFRQDLVFAAFDAEEGGLHGAPRSWRPASAEGPRGAGREPRHGGPRRQGRDLHRWDASQPEAAPLARAGRGARADSGLFGHDLPGSGHEDWTLQSDHGRFHQAGIPFVYFGVEDHPDYHQPSDTADKINPDFFVKAAGVVLDALRALDAGLR